MITVQNTVLDPAGKPVANAVVRISLVVSTTANVPGYLPTSDIIGTTTVATDAAGHWTADLAPNSDITPANTYYVVNESGFTSAIVVPATGGPYSLSQVVVNPPNPTPLGIHVAVNGALVGIRPSINLVAGSGATIIGADDPATGAVDVTVYAMGGGGGGGAVDTVNHLGPDLGGNVQLAAADVGAVALTGAQTVAGVKTFSAAPVVPAGAFPETAVAGLPADLAARALDSAVVHNTGAEAVAGVKTFTSAPVVPAAAFPESAVAGLPADLAARALDAAVVHNTGAETINGVKTFAAAPVLPAGALPESAVANLTTDLAGKVGTTQLGAANGVATLDSGGKLTAAQIPAIAIVTYLGAVPSQAAMLALVGQQGDWCTRTDLGTTWVITGADPTQLASWTQLSYPVAPVSSVNAQTGAVVLTAGNVGALAVANNLSEVTPSTARSNLGLGGAATANVGTAAGTVAAGDDSRIVGAAQKANNLSDLANAGTARGNLGLGGAATLNVGTAAGTVAAGNDSRIVGAAPAASPTLTGTTTVNGRLVTTPAALVDAATIATDASLGNHFRVTLGGNRTLGNPTNPVDGQRVIWELIQDGTGSRTIALDTAFALGADITAVTLSTGAGKRDFLGAVYNATAARWYIIAFVRGY